MATRKDDDAKPDQGPLVVVAPFAYATKPSGEVQQLTRGDVVDPGLYTPDSIDHLRAIGFVGHN